MPSKINIYTVRKVEHEFGLTKVRPKFSKMPELYLELLKFVFEKAWASFGPFARREIKNSRDYIEVLSNYITVQLNFFNENRNYTKILVDAMSSGAEEIPVAIKFIKTEHRDEDPTAAM